MSESVIQPVILCGGAGTRLWPLSREQHPKQLLALTGSDSLLQATVRRLDGWRPGRPVAAPLVVSNEEYRFITAEQFRCIDRMPQAILLEPVGRNTAPALTVAALQAIADGDDPILLVMPADHVLADVAAFQAAAEAGAGLAEGGAIVTFGIAPERAECGYGYLQRGPQLIGYRAWQVERFVEKPDPETAGHYVEDGNYLWNAGIFMLRASVWLAALATYAPEMAAACRAAWLGGHADGPFFRLAPQAFAATPADSIDYAVLEPLTVDPAAATPVVVLPLAAGWSDVGSWEALWRALDKDEAGNFASGDRLLEDVANSLVIGQGRLVACMGISDMVVIDTPDVVLVAGMAHAQDVRRIVARLKQAERREAASHRKQQRPWGYYDSIDCGERFRVKRIVVDPLASLSLQLHHHRAEHWVVVRGTARVTRGDEVFLLSENQSAYIPLGVRHRLENPGRVPLEMIEVQSGHYLGEDDIVRFADSYGRLSEAPASA